MADKESQQEYNEVLKITQSFLGDINRSMSNLSEETDKRNKKLSEQISLTQDVLSSVKSTEDTEAAINLLREQRSNISKQDFGVNNDLVQVYLAQLDAAEQILGSQKKNAEVMARVDETVSKTADGFKNLLEGASSTLREIPLIGNTLGDMFEPLKENSSKVIDKASEKFKDGFNKSFISARNSGQGFFTSFQSGLQSGMQSLKSFGKVAVRALGPVGIAVAAFVAGLGLGMIAFKALEDAARSFRDETGLLVSQTGEMNRNIESAFLSTTQLGASAEDVSKAASAFVNEFDRLEQPSEAVLTSIVTLNKNFGVGVQEATKLNKVFQNIGGLTATQSQLLVGQTAEMAKIAGVAPQQVIKDMADNAGAAYTFFGGMPEELAKAAVSAAKMGTSIKEAANVANSLLDYESSVTKELEASAILGTNLNLSRARYLAANNDILGAQQAVLDQVSNLGDLTNLNYYEQQALVEATGMELESLVNQQRIRERFGKLQGEQLAAANSLAESGVDITKATEEDLIAQQRRLESQKELQSITENISNQFSALKNTLSAAFMPLVTFVMPIVSDIITALNVMLMPLLKGIGAFLSIAFGILKPLYDLFRAILGPIFKIVGALFEGFVTPLMKAKELLSPLFDIFSNIGEEASDSGFVTAVESIAKVVGEVLFYITAIGAAIIGGPITGVVSIITGLVGLIGSTFGRIQEGGKSLQDIFTNITNGISQFFSTIGGFFSNLGGMISNVFSQIGPIIVQAITFIPSVLQNLFSKGLDIGNILLNNLVVAISRFSPFLADIFGDIGRNIMNSLSGIGDIFKGVFTLDFGLLMDGMKKVGGVLVNQISLIPKLLFNGLSNIGSFLVEKLTSLSPALGGILSNVFSNIGQYFSGIGDIFKGIFTLDFGLLMNGMKKIGGALLNYFTAIPKLLFNGLSNIGQFIFEKIKEGFLNLPNTFVEAFLSIGEKIRTFFEGLIPDFARKFFNVGKSDSSEVQESQQLSIAGSIDDGIVQDGNIVSTDPEDTLIASKEPQSLLTGLVENSPFAAIADGLSNVVGGQGGDNTLGNQQIIQKLDELKEAYMSNKDVYMDKEKVSSNVLKQNERSSENIFGLGFS